MKTCNESTERWPNALIDVSPDEFEEFLDHAESCPYHSAMLLEEEEDCLSVFHLARGLDSEGRILEGEELQSAIVEYQRQQEIWDNAATQMRAPFRHISLTNRGEEIASCGKFLAFPKHEGIHELDTGAGLQIWGVISEQNSQKILLGFMSLVDLKHPGEEHFLQLENNYTVGINVEPRGGNMFKIDFRCVENEELRKELLEKTQPQRKSSRTAAAKASGTGNSFSRSLIKKADQFGRQIGAFVWAFRQAIAVGTAAGLIFSFTFELVKPELPKTPNGSDNNSAVVQKAPAETSNPSTTCQNDPGKPTGADTEARIISQDSSGTHARTKRTIDSEPLAAEEHLAKRSEEPSDSLPLTSESKPLMPESPWLFQSVFDTGIGKESTRVVNSGSDLALGERLLIQFEHHLASLRVTNNIASVLDINREFRISWNIIRRENSATVAAVVTVDGQSKTIAHTTDGSYSEQACDSAVRETVAEVFKELGFEVREDEKSATKDAF